MEGGIRKKGRFKGDINREVPLLYGYLYVGVQLCTVCGCATVHQW